MTKQPSSRESAIPFVAATIHEFAYYKSLADRAIAQISDEQLHQSLDANINSVQVILKHLAGNLLSRWTDFLTTDGEKPNRDRDNEFIDDNQSRADILAKWETGWSALFATLTNLQPADLEKTIYIRSEPHTVYRAIQRQLSHTAYHVGQIVQLCRHWAGDQWQVLTIPRGGSNEFLAKMHAKFDSK
jgi:uncharacterized damage-inducible protein DinB